MFLVASNSFTLEFHGFSLKCLGPASFIWTHASFFNYKSFSAMIFYLLLCDPQELEESVFAEAPFTLPSRLACCCSPVVQMPSPQLAGGHSRPQPRGFQWRMLLFLPSKCRLSLTFYFIVCVMYVCVWCGRVRVFRWVSTSAVPHVWRSEGHLGWQHWPFASVEAGSRASKDSPVSFLHVPVGCAGITDAPDHIDFTWAQIQESTRMFPALCPLRRLHSLVTFWKGVFEVSLFLSHPLILHCQPQRSIPHPQA